MAQFAAIILKMIGRLKSGGTAGTDELAEAYWVINAVFRSLDSAGWFRQRMSRATATITAGNNYVALTTNVICVDAAYTYEATGGEIGTPLIVTAPEEVVRHGPLYSVGTPTHAWQTVAEVAKDTAARLYLNRRPDVDLTLVYFYRAAIEVMADGTGTLTLPDEFLRTLAYLSALSLARFHGLSLDMRALLQSNLDDAVGMVVSGQYMLDPTALADMINQQGPKQAQQGG